MRKPRRLMSAMNDPGVTDGGPAGFRLLAYGSQAGEVAAAGAAAFAAAALTRGTAVGALAGGGAAQPARAAPASPADSAAAARTARRRGARHGRAGRLTGTPRAGGSGPRRCRPPLPASR